MSDDDVDILVEQDKEGNWVARILHIPTGTIKISDQFVDREEAIADASAGFVDLFQERMRGLGEKK